jgi:hypothetical protein
MRSGYVRPGNMAQALESRLQRLAGLIVAAPPETAAERGRQRTGELRCILRPQPRFVEDLGAERGGVHPRSSRKQPRTHVPRLNGSATSPRHHVGAFIATIELLSHSAAKARALPDQAATGPASARAMRRVR